MTKKDGEETTLSLTHRDLEDYQCDGLEDAISEAISNVTGFCHFGFSYTIEVTTILDEGE
jgi:hypothetical protein